MPNLSALTPITTTATSLSNLILVTPQKTIGYQPQNDFIVNNATSQNQSPLLFHYEGEQTVTLESDITDHYIETNVAIQDQIALRPEVITTHGFIGELNDIAPIGLQTAQVIANKLITIGAYTPALSTTALLAYNEAFQLYQVAQNAINSAVSAWGTITGSQGESVIGNKGLSIQTNQSKQQRAFQQFYGYWSNRILFTVQTPWAVFQNMAIRTLRAIQDADTNVITDFEVSFKRIRLTTTTTVSQASALFLQGRLNNQAAPNTNLGNTVLTPSTPLSTELLTIG